MFLKNDVEQSKYIQRIVNNITVHCKKHFDDSTFEITFNLQGQECVQTLVLQTGTKRMKTFQFSSVNDCIILYFGRRPFLDNINNIIIVLLVLPVDI